MSPNPYSASLTRDPISAEEASRWLQDSTCGAIHLFCGVVRDLNREQTVTRIEYHSHEPLALKSLEKIVAGLVESGATKAIAIHRLGMLEVGETSILLGVSLPHRKRGFELLERGMLEIKSEVAVWKHEHYTDSPPEWIEGS
ncbi:MAG: molybdenum cofactor biosynthesis protein MoaE [Planctomycetota bacterium]|nr:molybdenum cofactor biosynthesis protein MoaE [Planctomycetota bacterium]